MPDYDLGTGGIAVLSRSKEFIGRANPLRLVTDRCLRLGEHAEQQNDVFATLPSGQLLDSLGTTASGRELVE
jgi:hypothetical protein